MTPEPFAIRLAARDDELLVELRFGDVGNDRADLHGAVPWVHLVREDSSHLPPNGRSITKSPNQSYVITYGFPVASAGDVVALHVEGAFLNGAHVKLDLPVVAAGGHLVHQVDDLDG
ncbi:hypothetical protein ACQBAU_17080 [Propionibacteriaceae bacterium Y2011]|uniref:hypothetical protein n=1 Tax=Microlunatus sp. Y2014 TaxID=3418488 RepID=UPI003B44C8FF